jgi:hypothetical protein
MEPTTQAIPPITPAQLSRMVDIRIEQLKKIFLTQIPKTLSEQFGDLALQQHVQDFASELMEKTIARFPVALTSIIPMMFSQPTKFHWELAKCLLKEGAEVKREVAERFKHLNYDVEKDIEKTKNEFEAILAKEYKTEVVLWRLMDENRWQDALTVIKAIEIERANADLAKKTEVANWKQQIAIYLGDVDMFFESLSTLSKIADKKLLHNPDEMVYAVTMLLSKTLVEIKLTPSFLGQMMISSKGTEFIMDQGAAFQAFLVQKIVDATLKDSIIHNGDDFRRYISETKEATITSFISLNPYVSAIRY